MAPEEHVQGISVATSLQLLDSLKLHSTVDTIFKKKSNYST